MILDSNLILSDAQAVTANGNSTNIIDTVKIGDAVNELYFVACVEKAYTGTGTIEVKLVTADDSDLTTNPVTLWSSGAIVGDNLVDKYCIGMIRLPKPEKVKRYIGAQFVVTDTVSGGALDVYLIDNPQTNI